MNLASVFDGSYTEPKIIGKGAFGIVMLASGAAIKYIEKTGDIEDKFQAREIEALEACRHPNVVTLIEHEYLEGDLYIALEYWDTSLFYDLRTPDPISMEKADWMLENILRGIAHIHSCGYLHRDIKPANILLRKRPQGDSLCIADFGHAVQAPDVSGTTAQSTNVCTRWYRSPEVTMVMPYNSAADVFSIGCVYVEIVRKAMGQNALPLFHDSRCSFPISGDKIDSGEHINNIFYMLGYPNLVERQSLRMSMPEPARISQWSENKRLCTFVESLPRYTRRNLGFPATQTAWLYAMIALNPAERIQAENALEWVESRFP